MIMFRSRDFLLVAMMLGMAAFTYKVKYEEQQRHAQIRQIERQVQAEKDMINLLKAEWALVSAPARLGRLAEHYALELELSPINPDQIVKVEDIPQNLPDDIEMLITKNDQAADLSVDYLLTGSVAP